MMSRLVLMGFTLGAIAVSDLPIRRNQLIANETVEVQVADEATHRHWQRTESSSP